MIHKEGVEKATHVAKVTIQSFAMESKTHRLNREKADRFIKIFRFLFELSADEKEKKKLKFDVRTRFLDAYMAIEVDELHLPYEGMEDGVNRFMEVLQCADFFSIRETVKGTLFIEAKVYNMWEMVDDETANTVWDRMSTIWSDPE